MIMLKLTAFFSFLALLLAPAAAAQMERAPDGPLSIGEVRIADGFQERVAEYGERDIDRLLDDLRNDVTAALMASGRLAEDGEAAGRIDLILVSATPNRPTMAQMRDRPGLSFQSFSRGGAELEAVIYDADGTEAGRIEYSWESPDLRDAWARPVWGDAQQTISRFARRLARDLNAS
jgi:hypothetical protein